VAEYLSQRFDLPVPGWTNEPEFFLDEEWDFANETFLFAEMLIDMTHTAMSAGPSRMMRFCGAMSSLSPVH
jgi:hypothetical protein